LVFARATSVARRGLIQETPADEIVWASRVAGVEARHSRVDHATNWWAMKNCGGGFWTCSARRPEAAPGPETRGC